MQIKMLRHWQGANGHVIKPATYEANDPTLLNMAEYLVENGYAIALDAPIENLVGVKVTEVYSLGIDSAIPSEDTTIETLVELSQKSPPTVPTVKPKSKR